MSGCRNTTGKPDPDACSKFCVDHPFATPCDHCGKPVTATYASLEVLGPYHSGCFGFPVCLCRERHEGECSGAPSDSGGGG